MKKIVALLLTCMLLLGVVSVHAEEVTDKYETLTVGITTPFSGNFLDDALGSNISDQDIRNLIHGYNLVRWDADKGAYEFNQPMVSASVVSEDSRTFIFALMDGLTYNDGTPITAADYAFSLLLLGSTELQEATGARSDISRIQGGRDYQSGKAKTLSGIQIMGENVFSLTIDEEFVPYFYQLKVLDVSPMPIGVIAPGCTVKSGDNGVYIDGPFTAELLKKTLADPETGYISHPSLTCGAYKLTGYDGNTVTLELNETFVGDEEGNKPTIPQIVVKVEDPDKIINDMAAGNLDLVVRCARENQTMNGIALVGSGDFMMKAYSRAGLSFISFCAEKGPTADLNVRKAAAMCIDKEQLTKEYLDRFGTTVGGYYGIGQWMFRMANGTIIQADDDESDWSDLMISRLDGYPFDPEAAAALLDEAGWNKNEKGEAYRSGVRCRKEGDKLVPLRLKLLCPAENGAVPLLQDTFTDHLLKAGIALEIETMPMTELLKVYYRQTERDCDMILMGTNFGDVFDPYGEYDENGTSYLNGITDIELMDLALQMRSTEPGEAAEYCRRWLAYEEQRIAVAAEIPIYSDAYLDFHISALQKYAPGPTGSWSMAIQSAYLSDYVEEEQETEGEGGESDEDFESDSDDDFFD